MTTLGFILGALLLAFLVSCLALTAWAGKEQRTFDGERGRDWRYDG